MEETVFIKSFENEAHIPSKIRHQNIIKFNGFCMHKRCMFLIYEFIEMGSDAARFGKNKNDHSVKPEAQSEP